MAKRSRLDGDKPREKGETAMTQNSKQATAAKVLPFRIIAFRVPARKFEEIEEHLKFAAWLIGQDAPLDWEDRETACRQLCDALCALRELRAQGEMQP